MIVVDSSVWIPHFSEVLTDEVQRLRAIRRLDDVVVGDLILLEMLQGARSDRRALELERALRTFRVEAMLGAEIAIAAARNYRTLRALGITVRKTADLIIGTFCIENGYRVLHRDRDFTTMQAHLGLQIYTG